MKIALLCLLITFCPAYAIFDYDRAILESQKGNWSQSTARLKKVLADQPDRADILYDSGISAYQNSEFDKALTYFTKSGDTTDAPQQLREQAYFNAGNAHVKLEQLQQAIESYDKVLALNPEHEKAKHNKEIVKKMLEKQKQQEQEENKKEDQNENNDKQQESADAEAKADKQNKEQSQEQNTQDKEQKKKQEEEKEHQQKDKDNQSQKENNQQQKQKEQNNKQSADAKAKADRQQQKQKKDKENRSQKQESADAKAQSTLSKVEGEDQQTTQKLSAALEHALKEREKKDAQLNKKMIKAMAAESHGGGRNDINCW